MAHFVSELKRRNVFKVATIYVVVSWLVLQVVTLIFPLFDIPMYASRMVVVLLALGFPIVLILAWAFDLTAEGIKWDSKVGERHVHAHVWDWVLGALLVVAIGLIVNSEIRNWQDRAAETFVDVPKQAPGKISELSIAVLPFANIGGDTENEYFSDGLTEEIRNLIARIPELKVIGRTSSFAFKGRNEDLRAIGGTLGVSTLLEGSVRKSGDRIRITAQLIDVADGAQIWSQTYERTLTDVFEVQDEVAASIIDAMEILVPANPTRGRPTDSADAYSLFLKARIATNEFEWLTSEALLKEAIAEDPSFAEAYELLAYDYWAMGDTIYSATEAQKLSNEAAARALGIDPDLALAKAISRASDVDDYSMLEKLEAFDVAARQQPEDARILDIYWYNLLLTGYLSEALQIAEHRLDVDPIALGANGRMPPSYFGNGQVAEGFAALALFDGIEKNHTFWYAGEANLAFGRDAIAVEVFEKNLAERGNTDTEWIAELIAGGRDPITGQAFMDERIPEIVASAPGDFAEELQLVLPYWYLYFGHLDRFFDFIFLGDPNNDEWSDIEDFIVTATSYRELGFTAHPKYLHVAELLGFFEVWEKRGPPDFCRKRDTNWVCD